VCVVVGPKDTVYVLFRNIAKLFILRQHPTPSTSEIDLIPYGINYATALAVSPYGKLAVVGSDPAKLLVVDEDEKHPVISTFEDEMKLSGVAFLTNGRLALADETNGCIRIVKADGMELSQFSTRGKGHEERNAIRPKQLCSLPNSMLLVSFANVKHLRIFNLAGQLQGEFGEAISCSAAVDSHRNVVYVCHHTRKEVWLYDEALPLLKPPSSSS